MRLWHYRLIPYLPRLQLVSQWRECCCIAKNIAEKGTPNHILVNKIMDYPIDHFAQYCCHVYNEMHYRGYKYDVSRLNKHISLTLTNVPIQVFPNWHNDIYLRQCLYNLEEKAMCNGIPSDEWEKIYKKFNQTNSLWHCD